MLKVCNADNHNQDAPNKQNLLCNYQSVMEVIQGQGATSRALKSPTVSFLQRNPQTADEEGQLIIIQDLSVNMAQVSSLTA